MQLYIADKKSSLPRPVKELKGFRKVRLVPGEEKTVSITIRKDALSYFDDRKQERVAGPVRGYYRSVVARHQRLYTL